MDFNATGDMYLLIVTCAVFAAGFLISLLPLAKRTRGWLFVAGPVGWIVWLLFASPAGEEGLAWAIIGGVGVLTWSGGLLVGHLVHRVFHPSPSGSLRARLYRLITLR
jgi:hypothetical protein